MVGYTLKQANLQNVPETQILFMQNKTIGS